MHKNVKKYFGLVAILIALFFPTFQINNYRLEEVNEFVYDKSIVSAGFWNLTGSPILIDELDPNYNWSKTADDNDWCYGSGTWNDPYIIENITIEAQALETNLIEIKNSHSSYFSIRNCNITHLDSPSTSRTGIKLYNSSKGWITNNNCSYSSQGITLERSDNNTVYDNIIMYNDGVGIFIHGGSNNTIIENKINNNTGKSIALDQAPTECKFNKVMHNKLEFNTGGINLVNGCEMNLIHNNSISNGGSAFQHWRAYHNNFTHNTVKKMENMAFYFDFFEHNKVINNTWQDCRTGVSFSDFNHNNDFINNTFINIEGPAIHFKDFSGITNFNNTFRGNLFYSCGMRIDFTPEEAVTTTIDKSNLVNGKPIYYYVNRNNLNSSDFINPGQIFLCNSSDSVLTNISISNTYLGISVQYSKNIEIHNNILTGNNYGGIVVFYSNETAIYENQLLENTQGGIVIGYSFRNEIRGNTAEANLLGIVLYISSEQSNVVDNFVYNNTHGIYIIYSNNNSIHQNKILNNTKSGIFAVASFNSTFYENMIKDNMMNGVNMDSMSENNTFYENYFVGNSYNAIDNGTFNSWDNGHIGNYWDDYSGIDANFDNIGDTPYNISGLAGSKDYLPMISPPSPVISIQSPLEYSLFGNSPPEIDLLEESVDTDTIWYFLDDGTITTNNYTFTGSINQNAWNLVGNGTVRIRFYINDTLGKVNFDEIFLRKDIIAPQISIISPTSLMDFEENSPTFELSIIEGNLDTIWYSLDSGINNFQCGTSGQINQVLWDSLPVGEIIIRFYSNDTLGNVDYIEITVTKSIPQTQPPSAIPGYNIAFLLGIISVIIILKLKKLNKK